MCHGCDISMVFCKAIAYAQSCIHQEELQLRPKQEETLLHLFNGKDVFVRIPTGYGKSLCYQLQPFMLDFKLKRGSSTPDHSVVLVISPLVFLMIDQVSKQQKRSIAAGILSGNTGTLTHTHKHTHLSIRHDSHDTRSTSRSHAPSCQIEQISHSRVSVRRTHEAWKKDASQYILISHQLNYTHIQLIENNY